MLLRVPGARWVSTRSRLRGSTPANAQPVWTASKVITILYTNTNKCFNPIVYSSDPPSQTASPKFGSVSAMSHLPRNNPPADARHMLFGSGNSTQASSEHIISPCLPGLPDGRQTIDVRGPSPIQGFLDNIRGPLPNPGNLLGMKAPPTQAYHHRGGSRSPLNCPLFPLLGQRRWSEAAAGEVRCDAIGSDPEANMRRWSMPWEASGHSAIVQPQQNTVAWHQTRMMPGSRFAPAIGGATAAPMPPPSSGKSTSDRSQSGTPGK